MIKPHICLMPYTDTQYRWTCSYEFDMAIIAGYGRDAVEAYEDFLRNVKLFEEEWGYL